MHCTCQPCQGRQVRWQVGIVEAQFTAHTGTWHLAHHRWPARAHLQWRPGSTAIPVQPCPCSLARPARFTTCSPPWCHRPPSNLHHPAPQTSQPASLDRFWAGLIGSVMLTWTAGAGAMLTWREVTRQQILPNGKVPWWVDWRGVSLSGTSPMLCAFVESRGGSPCMVSRGACPLRFHFRSLRS